MLQSIRDNSQSIVAKVIVGLIVVTFALFGVESLVSLTTGTKAPATVNGEEIGDQELFRAVELQRRQLLAQMGANADPAALDDNLIRTMVLDRLIDDAVLVQSANDQGMAISPQMLDQMIVSTGDFQLDGTFNRDQFEAVLRNVGLTPLTYRDYLRRETLIEQEKSGYQLSAFVTDNQLKNLLALDRQTRDMAWFEVPAAPVRAQIEVSDADIAARYEARRDLYQTEEQVSIRYLLLDKASLLGDIEVTDAELQGQYQQVLGSFSSDEEREAAHILIEVSDDQDASAAEAKAQALKKQLDEGADFAALAQANSDDPGSAASGGDLGLNARGMFVGPFEDALFAMKDEGEVSAPVRTEFGYHLIKLGKIVQTEAPSLDEMKADLREQILTQKGESRYVEQLERLADVTFSSGNLEEPAEELQLDIQTTEPFGRTGGSDAISANPRVLAAAFSTELINDGVNSAPIELDAGRSVVIRVQEHLRPRQQTQDEVADVIRQELLDEKAAARIDALAGELLQQLKQGADMAELAAAQNQTLTELVDVSRASQELATEVRAELFRMPQPQADTSSYASVELNNGGRAIVALKAVTVPDLDDAVSADELKAMRAYLAGRQGQQDYQDLVRTLKGAAEIEKN
ncbi:peptidylprolyl isomerase [Marinobacterium aestuarii]|uniref:Periplasmic chaperone PpiD n=1 Tax=Marinobacterium aestuarii TaxID=1821621 RepID=A0A1A9EXF2_9GAMM|nr:SurA N-terminal domain-containing protein [Marinobacterium aestuarii]ANG62420.1 peptidylprolyl isomerase [Marinobacterium aestuarii]